MQLIARLLLAMWLGTFVPAAALAQPARTLGRVEPVGASGFRMEWPMSGLEARFTGGVLTAVIEDTGNNWLNVDIDGLVTPVALSKGRKTYQLFSGAPGAHIVRVTRRTGALAGATTFVSLTATGLTPTEAPTRRMLVIGDSISAGYGVEGADQHCSYSTATQNAGTAWPALLARAYQTDLQLIAVDGRGVYRNYSGGERTMPALMQLQLPSGKTSWRGKFSAQLVIVHLGTNDFDKGDPGPNFRAAYQSLLLKVRLEQPDAEIIAAIGGMLDPEKLAMAKKAIEGAVAARRTAGDRKVTFVYLDPPTGGRRFGCDWHPGKDAQSYMARTLQSAIEGTLGWRAAAIN
ncbi:MAG TPA: GDSL-type esterase/lipase family protein [Hyphomonadaceae bacterium]|nr:GDSL-type esterase/lipase family protein [Hyphomonadaceae bacterium]